MLRQAGGRHQQAGTQRHNKGIPSTVYLAFLQYAPRTIHESLQLLPSSTPSCKITFDKYQSRLRTGQDIIYESFHTQLTALPVHPAISLIMYKVSVRNFLLQFEKPIRFNFRLNAATMAALYFAPSLYYKEKDIENSSTTRSQYFTSNRFFFAFFTFLHIRERKREYFQHTGKKSSKEKEYKILLNGKDHCKNLYFIGNRK